MPLTVGVTIRVFPSPRAFTKLVVCAKNNLLNDIFVLLSRAIWPIAALRGLFKAEHFLSFGGVCFI